MNRREALRTLLAGGALGAVSAGAVYAAVPSSQIVRDNALFALEPELAAAEAEMAEANRVYDEALRIGRSLWPVADRAIRRKWGHPSDLARCVEGAGYKDQHYIIQASELRGELRRLKCGRRTPENLAAREAAAAAVALSEKYYADCEHAHSVSGQPEACKRRTAAHKTLSAAISRVMAERSQTMEGALFKARAVASWQMAPEFVQLINLDGQEKWGGQLAAAIMEAVRSGHPQGRVS